MGTPCFPLEAERPRKRFEVCTDRCRHHQIRRTAGHVSIAALKTNERHGHCRTDNHNGTNDASVAILGAAQGGVWDDLAFVCAFEEGGLQIELCRVRRRASAPKVLRRPIARFRRQEHRNGGGLLRDAGAGTDRAGPGCTADSRSKNPCKRESRVNNLLDFPLSGEIHPLKIKLGLSRARETSEAL